jgi:hypothetical protein
LCQPVTGLYRRRADTILRRAFLGDSNIRVQPCEGVRFLCRCKHVTAYVGWDAMATLRELWCDATASSCRWIVGFNRCCTVTIVLRRARPGWRQLRTGSWSVRPYYLQSRHASIHISSSCGYYARMRVCDKQVASSGGDGIYYRCAHKIRL